MSSIPVTNSGHPIIISPARERLLRTQSNEFIFEENSERWVLLPIEYPTIWEFYKRIESSFWTPEDFGWKDEASLLKTEARLSESAFRWLLDFSACFNVVYGAPGLSAETEGFPDILDLSCEFVESIQTPEGRAFLGFQSLFENFHREVFTRFVETFLGKEDDRLPSLYLSNYERPNLLAKQQWLDHHMAGFHHETKKKKLAGDVDESHVTRPVTPEGTSPMAEVLVSLVVLKGLFFSSLALVQLICRSVPQSSFYKASKQMLADMLLHADFAAHLYSSLHYRLDLSCLKTMLIQAAEIEFNFLIEVIGPTSDSNLSREDMGDFLCDLIVRALRSFGYHEEADLHLPSSALPTGGSGTRLSKALDIPPPFAVVHKGPFKIIPIEKQTQPVTTAASLDLTEDF